MIEFNPLHTRRLSVELQELSLEEAEALCLMPEQLEQAATTRMLGYIVKPDNRPMEHQVTDPQLWTVQERTMVMAHYMAHVNESGERNFAIGEHGRFGDYLLGGTDYIESVPMGELDGHDAVLYPLLGYQAEAIERVIHGGRVKKNRLSWWICAMACQIGLAGEPRRERMPEAEFTEWLVAEAAKWRAIPSSEFEPALFAFLDASERMNHFFKIAYTDNEIGMQPREEGSTLPLARFPVRAAIRKSTLRILGVAD